MADLASICLLCFSLHSSSESSGRQVEKALVEKALSSHLGGYMGWAVWGEITGGTNVCGIVESQGTAVAGPPDPKEPRGLGFRDADRAQQPDGICLRCFPETPPVLAVPE